MRKLLTICVALIVSVAICASPAYAAITYGTPYPALDPVFGTLVDFDDQGTGTPVGAGDYAAVGVASITEESGIGTIIRGAGTQSPPNYIGTGAANGWNGLIRIDLANPASQIGLGVADSAGTQETLSVYDSDGVLLESHLLTPGLNIYVVITRPSHDISRIEIGGEFFAIDDLQFDALISADIDIKPGSCPNPLNPKSQGRVPVAIVGTADFDPTTVDVSTIELMGVSPIDAEMIDSTQPGDYDPADCYDCFNADDYLTDPDGDGIFTYEGDGMFDLVLYFDTQELVAAIGAADKGACLELNLTGETIDGIPIEGSDSMRILKEIK